MTPATLAGVRQRDLGPALDIIKRFEGLVDGDPSTVKLDPYLCPAGYWTIGWGHVVIGPDGRAIRGRDHGADARAVYPGGITAEEAEVLLRDDVRRFAVGVEASVTVSVTDVQFCALVSFAFNVGLGAFRRSTLLSLLNQGQHDAVPRQLMRWTRSNHVELPGLRRRREAEAALWSSNG